MGEHTEIGWTDATFNGWQGCARVSRGCQHCYAADLTRRWGKAVWGVHTPRIPTSDAYWRKPETWNRKAARTGTPYKVFASSLADVFEDHPALPPLRARLFDLVERTPWLIWQFLTKRPENIAGMVPWAGGWPPNVWTGTSVESQRFAAQRLIPLLSLRGPTVRYASCEPLVGPLNPTRVNIIRDRPDLVFNTLTHSSTSTTLDWVIAGGESGAKASPMHPDWARSLRDQCVAAGVPFFFKQWGWWAPSGAPERAARYVLPDGRVDDTGYGPLTPGAAAMTRVGKTRAGRMLDGRTWDEFPPIHTPTGVAT